MIYGSSNFFSRPKANLFCSKFVSPCNFILSEVGIHATVKKT